MDTQDGMSRVKDPTLSEFHCDLYNPKWLLQSFIYENVSHPSLSCFPSISFCFSSLFSNCLSAFVYNWDLTWNQFEVVYMWCFHIFKWTRAIFFPSVAMLGERFHLDGYMRMLSADLKSCGLRQEHGVNSRRIRLMWVCGSSVWSVCLTVCFSAGMSSVNPSSLSLTQIRSAVWVICFFSGTCGWKFSLTVAKCVSGSYNQK